VLAVLFCCPASALASSSGVEHLKYAAGPYDIHSGANLILTDLRTIPKPMVNGFMVRFAPNLHYALPNGKCCGKIPRTDVIHLHHGVWLSNGAAGAGEGNGYAGFYPFMASGEEKTIYSLPPGFGYPIGANDQWILNYMIHDLWPQPAKVYITYEMDFIPDSSPAARGITPVHPIWLDVEAHHIYPVFNVQRSSGRNGKFTFPDMAKDPYKGDPTPLNEFTVDHPGMLVGTAGHVHPGGLYDTLDLIRPGAAVARKAIHGSEPDSVRLFRSYADYFDKRAGPINWNMAMTATAPSWRPRVQAGDVLRISATYDTRRASWYEVMGIMVVWEAYDGQVGVDPFTGAVDLHAHVSGVNAFAHAINEKGHVTHGYLVENRHTGGGAWLTVNPNKLPTCPTHTVIIAGFRYNPGDLEAPGAQKCAPAIRQGQSLTFINDDASSLAPGVPGIAPSLAYENSIFHTITACQNPCGLDTGISYPLANGTGAFDSGQLGDGTPASGQLSWSTPTNLPAGTYTFFCRIHPFMRGVFRIIG
jgi:hypothetical protein